MFIPQDPMRSWQTDAQVQMTSQYFWDYILKNSKAMFGNKSESGRLFDFSSDQKSDDCYKMFGLGVKLIAQESSDIITIERPVVDEATKLQAYQDKIAQLEKQLRQKT